MIAITWLTLSWMTERRRVARVGPDHQVAVDGTVG
jgi:hypothetical protein